MSTVIDSLTSLSLSLPFFLIDLFTQFNSAITSLYRVSLHSGCSSLSLRSPLSLIFFPAFLCLNLPIIIRVSSLKVFFFLSQELREELTILVGILTCCTNFILFYSYPSSLSVNGHLLHLLLFFTITLLTFIPCCCWHISQGR